MKPADLYIDLLKRSLLNVLYIENEVRIRYLLDCLGASAGSRPAIKYDRTTLDLIDDDPRGLATINDLLTRVVPEGNQVRAHAHAMMGRKRLDNIEHCVRTILSDGVPGDLLEAGVWKGAGPILMSGILKALDAPNRKIWLADSFAGLPPPSLPQDEGLDLTAQKFPWLAVSQQRVENLLERYGLLSDQLVFLRGWFKDTLPAAPVEKLALLRLDGDLYESTMDTLIPLYDKVQPGGFIIVDDYNDISACRQAVNDFRAERGIADPIEAVDYTGVFWRKT